TLNPRHLPSLTTRRRRSVAPSPISPTMTSTTNNNDATDMEALYRRAVADASSLTQAEINLIFDWVSPEEDKYICRTKANGKTRAELIAIAATNPEQLTSVECLLVLRSTAFLIELRREAQNPNQPPDMMELIDGAQHFVRSVLTKRKIPLYSEAYQAIWNAFDDQERLAIIAVQDRLSQIRDEEWAEGNRKYPRRMQQPE
ncbi:hypothetical protein C8A01DRAFT_19400, partial [Parachaetomium inaequale]